MVETTTIEGSVEDFEVGEEELVKMIVVMCVVREVTLHVIVRTGLALAGVVIEKGMVALHLHTEAGEPVAVTAEVGVIVIVEVGVAAPAEVEVGVGAEVQVTAGVEAEAEAQVIAGVEVLQREVGAEVEVEVEAEVEA